MKQLNLQNGVLYGGSVPAVVYSPVFKSSDGLPFDALVPAYSGTYESCNIDVIEDGLGNVYSGYVSNAYASFQLSYAREIVIFNSSVYTCSGLVVGVTHTLYFYTEAGSLLLIKHVPVGSFNFTFSSLVDGYVYLSICFMDPPTGGYGVVDLQITPVSIPVVSTTPAATYTYKHNDSLYKVTVADNMRDTNLIDVPDHTATKYFGAAVYYFPSNPPLLLMPATTYTLIYDYEIIDEPDAHLRTSIGYGDTTFKAAIQTVEYPEYPEGLDGTQVVTFTTPVEFNAAYGTPYLQLSFACVPSIYLATFIVNISSVFLAQGVYTSSPAVSYTLTPACMPTPYAIEVEATATSYTYTTVDSNSLTHKYMADVYGALSKVYAQFIGITYLTGTETWYAAHDEASTVNGIYRYYTIIDNMQQRPEGISPAARVLCDTISTPSAYTSPYTVELVHASYSNRLYLCINKTRINNPTLEDVTNLKAYLAALCTAGTPIKIYYIRAEPIGKAIVPELLLIDPITDREQLDCINGTPKGFLQASDLSRINNNILLINARLTALHYAEKIQSAVQANWVRSMYLKLNTLNEIKQNIMSLLSSWHGLEDTPTLVDSSKTTTLGFQEINDMEKIIADIFTLLQIAENAARTTGVFNIGNSWLNQYIRR